MVVVVVFRNSSGGGGDLNKDGIHSFRPNGLVVLQNKGTQNESSQYIYMLPCIADPQFMHESKVERTILQIPAPHANCKRKAR